MTVNLGQTEPCPVDKRPKNYFKAGEEVVCFVGESDNILPKKAFSYIHGFIVSDEKNHDDYIVVGTKECVKRDGNYTLHYKPDRPCIMHAWEYDYFKEFPEELKPWLHTAPLACNLTILKKMAENF